MLASADLMAFVATARPEKARDFYEKTLGLKFRGDEQFALVFDANGVMVRVFKVESVTPAMHTVLGWGVPDISATVRHLRSKGVAFERFDGMQQDEDDVWISPSGARVAWFKDPDGNVLSLTQFS